jgi:transcription elongation GreA/GreB family factor
MQVIRSRADKLKVRDEGPVYLTPEGIQALKNKLARLKASISDLASEAKRAADYGDRSENAEYKEAKGKLRGAHRQIISIEDQLKRSVAIKTGPNVSGEIQLGSTVVLEKVKGNGSTSSPQTFQIVGSYETDPAKGRISHRSPLGAALIGRVKGDEVTISTANGDQTYRIIEVR